MTDFATGWVEDSSAVSALLEELPQPFASNTPAGQVEELPERVHLWDIARKVTGALLPPRNQGAVGSCVSFGTARAVEYSMVCEIFQGEPEQFVELATEVIYGGSRVEIGGGKLSGDGSVGAWAADWCRKYGVLGREKYNEIDLTIYDEKRCREWGKSGIPTSIEDLAKLHPTRSTTLVQNWEEARRMLASGYGIALCSSQGFSMIRDGNGISAPKGIWNHCMTLCGYDSINGQQHGRFDNSWGGEAHTGPVGPGAPGPEGFWASAIIIDKMLRQGDSWAFSCVEGFPARKLRWIL
jgi:hypothetical protein